MYLSIIRGSIRKLSGGGGASSSYMYYRPHYHSLYSDTFMPPFGGGGGGGGGRKVGVHWSHSQTTQQWHVSHFVFHLNVQAITSVYN